jgi:hypothetical protein
MIPSLETERMWARPVRLEDAEQVQKIFSAVGDCEAPWRRGAVAVSSGRCARTLGRVPQKAWRQIATG